MSISSKRVKDWRENTKQRIVDAFGGKCCICSYNRCLAGFDLHHLNPSKKEFGFGAIRANPKSWENTIVPELRKCVLLCSNCHREVHHGDAVVPLDAPSFDESYVFYRVNKKTVMEPCPVCLEPKSTASKTCSIRKVPWDDIDLEKELLTKNKSQIAKELGVSEAAVRKRLKKVAKLRGTLVVSDLTVNQAYSRKGT